MIVIGLIICEICIKIKKKLCIIIVLHHMQHTMSVIIVIVDLDNQPVRMRDRSNSADSWASALQEIQPESKSSLEGKSKTLPPLIQSNILLQH